MSGNDLGGATFHISESVLHTKNIAGHRELRIIELDQVFRRHMTDSCSPLGRRN
jgi:hypothetical protein